MYSDSSGQMPVWLQWVLGGSIVVGLSLYYLYCWSSNAYCNSSCGEIAIGTLGELAPVGTAVAGIIVLLAKRSGHRIGHNPFENKQFKYLCKKYKLTKDKEENLHREISQKIYIYKEVEEII